VCIICTYYAFNIFVRLYCVVRCPRTSLRSLYCKKRLQVFDLRPSLRQIHTKIRGQGDYSEDMKLNMSSYENFYLLAIQIISAQQ
jgi:hypothetical protein